MDLLKKQSYYAFFFKENLIFIQSYSKVVDIKPKLNTYMMLYGRVAQWIRRWTSYPKSVGSSPATIIEN